MGAPENEMYLDTQGFLKYITNSSRELLWEEHVTGFLCFFPSDSTLSSVTSKNMLSHIHGVFS